jgi:hypothetical protein
LYESCGELLDEIVKSKCRDLAYKASAGIIEKASKKWTYSSSFNKNIKGIKNIQ